MPYTRPVNLPGLNSTNVSDSPYLPTGQRALPPSVPGITDVDPERIGTDFGSVTSFKYPSNDYEVLKSVTLVVRLSPLDAGAGGDTARYSDDVLCQAIEKIVMTVGGTPIGAPLYGDEMHYNPMVEATPEEKKRLWGMQAAGLTIAERAILAATPQTVMLTVPMFWSKVTANAYHQYAVQRQTKFEITWRDKSFILQQNTANTAPVPKAGYTTYIDNMFLRFEVSALDTAVKDAYTQGVKRLGESGLDYMFQYQQRQTDNYILTGQTAVNHQLTNFNKPTYMVRFWIRPTANLLPSYLNNDRFATPDILSFYYGEASGHKYVQKTEKPWAVSMINGKYFLGDPTLHRVWHGLFTDFPDVKQYPMGVLEFSKLQNPTIHVELTGAAAVDYTVDYYAYCYNYCRIVITSDNRAAVTTEQPI